jgi:hypothetical protein
VRDDQGKVIKIIKLASDVTEKVAVQNIQETLVGAVDWSLATIRFNCDATIIDTLRCATDHLRKVSCTIYHLFRIFWLNTDMAYFCLSIF